MCNIRQLCTVDTGYDLISEGWRENPMQKGDFNLALKSSLRYLYVFLNVKKGRGLSSTWISPCLDVCLCFFGSTWRKSDGVTVRLNCGLMSEFAYLRAILSWQFLWGIYEWGCVLVPMYRVNASEHLLGHESINVSSFSRKTYSIVSVLGEREFQSHASLMTALWAEFSCVFPPS